jgi:hypothetical protein
MIVKYRKTFTPKRKLKSLLTDFGQSSFDYCCTKMALAAREGVIGISTDGVLDKSYGLHIFSCDYDTSFRISYCPFCGEQIEIAEEIINATKD